MATGLTPSVRQRMPAKVEQPDEDRLQHRVDQRVRQGPREAAEHHGPGILPPGAQRRQRGARAVAGDGKAQAEHGAARQNAEDVEGLAADAHQPQGREGVHNERADGHGGQHQLDRFEIEQVQRVKDAPAPGYPGPVQDVAARRLSPGPVPGCPLTPTPSTGTTWLRDCDKTTGKHAAGCQLGHPGDHVTAGAPVSQPGAEQDEKAAEKRPPAPLRVTSTGSAGPRRTTPNAEASAARTPGLLGSLRRLHPGCDPRGDEPADDDADHQHQLPVDDGRHS